MLILYLCLVADVLSAPTDDETTLRKSEECRTTDCYVSPDYECDEACGCDSALVYNETTGECTLKEFAMVGVIHIYDNNKDPEAHESFLAKNIKQEAESLFKGITIAAILFITCATVYAFAACLYCCRINYSDRRLASDVKALTVKLRREGRLPMSRASVKKTNNDIGESCPVVVEDAGIFVV